MEKFMRAWVFGCMLLFALRQFLPNFVQTFDVLGLLAIATVLVTSVWIVTGAYRYIRESLQKDAVQHEA